MILHVVITRPSTSHPYIAGTDHVKFTPDQAGKHQVQSAVTGELHPAQDSAARSVLITDHLAFE